MKNTCRRTVLSLILLLLLSAFACSEFKQIVVSTPTSEPTDTPTPSIRLALESNVDSFIPGYAKYDGGYFSDAFRIGIQLPEGWTVCEQEKINLLNSISADPADRDTFADECITKLKQGGSLVEYYAYRDDPYGMILVIVYDMTNADEVQYSEVDMLGIVKNLLLDYDKDQIPDVDDLELTACRVFGGEHPAYQFSNADDSSQVYGAITAYKMGTLFEVVEVMDVSQENVNQIMQGMYNEL